MIGRHRKEIDQVRTKHKKVIELFNEKTGEVVRTIIFRSPKEFDEFVKGFNAMRYPGYSWRYRDKEEKTEKHE